MIEELKVLVEFLAGVQADVIPFIVAYFGINLFKFLVMVGSVVYLIKKLFGLLMLEQALLDIADGLNVRHYGSITKSVRCSIRRKIDRLTE